MSALRRKLPAADERDLAALRQRPPQLAPRAIGAAGEAASFQRLLQASRELDLPVPEIVRQSLAAVLGVTIAAPGIPTDDQH